MANNKMLKSYARIHLNLLVLVDCLNHDYLIFITVREKHREKFVFSLNFIASANNEREQQTRRKINIDIDIIQLRRIGSLIVIS